MKDEEVRLHGQYDAIEEQFEAALDASLAPRGPEMLYDLVAGLGLRPGAAVLDVGCGEGRHALVLAERFGLNVLGIDPWPRYDAIEIGSSSVSFGAGTAETLPVGDASIDLVWCRDVLSLIEDLDRAYAEFRRVLKSGGHALIYQTFATERLEPREAAWLLPTMGCVPASMGPERTESAIAAAGFAVERCIVLGTEWGEHAQEADGKPGRKLLHASRLLRDPERYIERFGGANYEIALGDCLWHVYRLIGKLSGRVYVLCAP